MKNKVIFIGPLPPPLGGVATINKSFQSLEYPGYFMCSFNTSNGDSREDLYKRKSIKSIFMEFLKYKNLKKFLDNEKPDVANIFITSGIAIIRDLFFLRILKKNDVPTIIHFHSKTKGEFALKPKRLKIVGKLFDKYANKIILLSGAHLQYFQKFLNKEKCVVIENFVDYSNFDCDINNKTDEFLFVGRLTKQKGFYNLIEAVEILKNQQFTFKLNIIGLASSDEDQIKVENIIKNKNLNTHINLLGPKFDKDKNIIFKKTKCLIFPSHFENSPVVLKEAIAAKMAIIASDIFANKNVLGERNNFLLSIKDDSLDLANQMKYILENLVRTMQMCQSSDLIKEYSAELASKKLNDLMNQIVEA
jgi:glycosyltransferase involved in cell wall biosynthesis